MKRFRPANTVTADGARGALPPLLELVDMLEARHPDLDAHGLRVEAYAKALARELGLPAPAVARVGGAARLHDIGKAWIAPEILEKPGPLTESEWREIRRHPSIGARLLQSVALYELADIVLAHHERPDALGYPHGVPSGAGPLEGQIVAVTDAYDAMLSPRPYGPSLTEPEARAELRRVAGTQLDAFVVEAFLRVLADGPPVVAARPSASTPQLPA